MQAVGEDGRLRPYWLRELAIPPVLACSCPDWVNRSLLTDQLSRPCKHIRTFAARR